MPASIRSGGVARIDQFFSGWRNGVSAFPGEVEQKNLGIVRQRNTNAQRREGEWREKLVVRQDAPYVLRVTVAHMNKNKNIFLHFPKQLPKSRCATPKKMCRFAQHP